jgi:hypothetical protein
MTDEQIEQLICGEIKKRDITFHDMIGLVNENIDPNPQGKTMPSNKRARINRFSGLFGSERMQELLCVGKYCPYSYLPPLKVSLQDLFRFWWNRCVEQDLVVAEILEDIFSYFTELMRPPEKKEKEMDLAVDFAQVQVSFFSRDLEHAA